MSAVSSNGRPDSTSTSPSPNTTTATVVRRRGTAPSLAAASSDSDLFHVASATTTADPPSRSHSPPSRSPSTASSRAAGAGTTVFSATTTLPDGTRLAWDPTEHFASHDTDIVPLADPLPVPDLTLMEQVLLLGLKDRAGYLSFWNDSLSYVLRGCILMELALRGRIAMVARPDRRRLPLADRPVRVMDPTPTGETLLDETLKCMRLTQEGAFVGTSSASAPTTGTDFTPGGGSARRANSGSDAAPSGWGGLFGTWSNSDSTPATTSPTASTSPSGGASAGEQWGVGSWMDLLSGETWNLLRVNYQLRQVRERLAKGLVDKGVLRTERRSFVLFDMATHPVADQAAKDRVINKVLALVRSAPKSTAWPPDTSVRHVALVAAAQAGNVLENVLARLPTLGDREAAWQRADELLAAFAKWPVDVQGAADTLAATTAATPAGEKRRASTASASSGSGTAAARGIPSCKVMGLDHLEVVAAVLSVFARMDSLL